MRYVTEPLTLVERNPAYHWTNILAVVIVTIVVIVAAHYNSSSSTQSLHSSAAALAQHQQHIFNRCDVLFILFLLAIGAVQGFTRLDGTGFQNDEWYHVEAAEGYRQTGQFVWWDFLNDNIRLDQFGAPQQYTRAAHYTWLVAQSVNLFGWSETAARLPSVMFYLLLIMVCYGFTKWWSRSTRTAVLVTLVLLLFDHVIFHGRLVRMYSMLLAFGVATYWVWIAAYMESMRAHVNKKKLAMQLSGGVVLLTVTVITHSVFLLFPVLFGVFVCVEAWLRRVREKKWNRISLYWVLCVLCVGIAGLVAAVTLQRYELFELVGWLNTPNDIYALFPFVDFPLAPLAATVYLIACWKSMRSTDTVSHFLVLVSALSIVMFVFMIQRYDALRYSIVFTPLVAMLVVRTWNEVVQQFTSAVRQRPLRYILSTAVLIITIVPLSWPGVEENIFMNTARADRTHQNGYGADIQAAYRYIQEHRASDEAVFAVLFHSYYWTDATAPLVNMGVEQSLTASELQELMTTYQKGWIVWSNRKQHHLSNTVKEYVQTHAEHISDQVPELKKSNMQVYYFSASQKMK